MGLTNREFYLLRALDTKDEKQVWKVVAEFIKSEACAGYDLCTYLITWNRIDVLVHLQYDIPSSRMAWSIIHNAVLRGHGDVVFKWLCRCLSPYDLLLACMTAVHGVVYVERNIDWFIHMCGVERVISVLGAYGAWNILTRRQGFHVSV
jgi:hypothetical protein